MASKQLPFGEQEDPEQEDAEEGTGRELEAWERAYADDRSWESLQEDESGLLRPVDKTEQQRQHRHRLIQATSGPRIRRGIIRYLYVIVDLSRVALVHLRAKTLFLNCLGIIHCLYVIVNLLRAAAEMDFRPSNMAVVANCVEVFIREFFDQNPLSHLGLLVIRNGLAQRITDLSGSPEAHIKALRNNLETGGEASLQNALDLARAFLGQIPLFGHREVLLIFSAFNTCDPGDIMETIKKCKEAKMRCSVVGLSAEIYICKHLCEQTGGTYAVALNENHLKEVILEHAPPPPALADSAVASLVRMGFPQRGSEQTIALCSCHRELTLGGGYACPRCKARVCELPTECFICGLTLVSSPHLARSYHHLFPVATFEEVSTAITSHKHKLPKVCFGCQQELPIQGNKIGGMRFACPRCKHHFCFDCDIYIHESLHNCPGCESLPDADSPSKV